MHSHQQIALKPEVLFYHIFNRLLFTGFKETL